MSARLCYVGDNAAKGLVLSLARNWREFGRDCYVRKVRRGAWGIFARETV